METLAPAVLTALPLVLDGLAVTVAACATAIALAAPLAALLVAAGRSRSRVARIAARVYVGLLRGLPIVVVVFLLFFGLPAALGLGRLSAFWVGVAALALNGAAFVSEVMRAAIDRVPRGQWESATALGLRPLRIWRLVVLPQALPIALPALVGEATFLVKASPVVSLIGVVDLTRRAQQVSMQTFDPLAPMLAAAMLYFLVLFTLSRLGTRLERRGAGAVR